MIIVALTREHDGWESRLRDEQPAAQSGQVPCSGARRQGKVLDVVSATIHGDEVAVNKQLCRSTYLVFCNDMQKDDPPLGQFGYSFEIYLTSKRQSRAKVLFAATGEDIFP